MTEIHSSVAATLARLDEHALHRDFEAQGKFVFLPEFLGPDVTARLIAAATALASHVNRNYVPGHKQGGSISRYQIDTVAPDIGALYRSPVLMAWLETLAGERLQVSPHDDPHAYALYFYTRPGDHIGWHYDTSYYAGRRYTLLLGVVDESSCRLEYQLYTREPDRVPCAGAVQIPPGGLAFFDGDRLRHRITPLGVGERRVSLTFEYVTDPSMSFGRRLISDFKDAFAYFGLRQVFGGRGPNGRRA